MRDLPRNDVERAVANACGEAVRRTLVVLETGVQLGTDFPWLGADSEMLWKRIRDLRDRIRELESERVAEIVNGTAGKESDAATRGSGHA